ncbi:hypothetical protein DFH06DRAFT_1123098 [Mycena polygramma]|nr:hypothetical protein DFH06DRAFT_1123098 [Mycena polygramma]
MEVVGFGSDVIHAEKAAMKCRTERVLRFASTWDPASFKLSTHSPWAFDLCVLALAVPDTHGLLIPACLKKLPKNVKSQLSANHTDWVEFRDAICALSPHYNVLPDEIPLPWFKQLPPDVPFTIGNEPSESGLPVRLNRFVPPVWRGGNPDRSKTNKESRAYVDDSAPLFREKFYRPSPTFDPTKPVFETADDYDDPPTKDELLFSNPELFDLEDDEEEEREGDVDAGGHSDGDDEGEEGDEEEGDREEADKEEADKEEADEEEADKEEAEENEPSNVGEKKPARPIRYGRYHWPQKLLGGIFSNQAYSEEQAFSAAGLQLVAVPFHPRLIILDLKNAFLEVHLLEHTSLQIFTVPQYEERICRVPNRSRKIANIRGFKVAFALVMRGYVLAFNSADNNFRVAWRTRKKEKVLQEIRVPDAVLDYFAWSLWAAKFLRYYAPRRKSKKTIYQWISMPGSRHQFQGTGSYMTDELLARAATLSGIHLTHLRKGIPPTMAAYDVLNSPYLYKILHDTYVQLLIESVYRTRQRLKTGKKLNKAGEFAMIVTHKAPVAVGFSLRCSTQPRGQMSAPADLPSPWEALFHPTPHTFRATSHRRRPTIFGRVLKMLSGVLEVLSGLRQHLPIRTFPLKKKQQKHDFTPFAIRRPNSAFLSLFLPQPRSRLTQINIHTKLCKQLY